MRLLRDLDKAAFRRFAVSSGSKQADGSKKPNVGVVHKVRAVLTPRVCARACACLCVWPSRPQLHAVQGARQRPGMASDSVR